jgi:hypothetical protein
MVAFGFQASRLTLQSQTMFHPKWPIFVRSKFGTMHDAWCMTRWRLILQIKPPKRPGFEWDTGYMYGSPDVGIWSVSYPVSLDFGYCSEVEYYGSGSKPVRIWIKHRCQWRLAVYGCNLDQTFCDFCTHEDQTFDVFCNFRGWNICQDRVPALLCRIFSVLTLKLSW